MQNIILLRFSCHLTLIRKFLPSPINRKTEMGEVKLKCTEKNNKVASENTTVR